LSDYHFFGIVAAATFMLTVLGLYFQLILVINRRVLFLNNALENDRPTNVLSLNQLNSVFLACYSFYLYGICTTPINHYLAWPRLMAMGVLLFLFYQILIDRQNRWSKLVFFVAIFLLIASLSIFLFKEEVQDYGKYFAQGLVILATLVLAQGYLHQIIMIRRSGRTGAVSIRFHQCVLLTALSTVAFGFAIGIKNGWPLILLASVSTTLKVITLWHFRWVKISKIAEHRRGKFIGL
jgi:uncharacterized protein with PQ loop repeat